MDMLAVRSYDL